MGEAKRRKKIDVCYLCGQPLIGAVNVDHVPPKLSFPEELRKGLNLLTIRTHVACNSDWRMDEEYFVHTLVPFARGTPSGNAAIRQSLKKYQVGRNVPLINMVMDEFKHVVNGVHLPANRVAKLIDADRFHDVLYKIVRGLHFHHAGEILPPHWTSRTPSPHRMRSRRTSSLPMPKAAGASSAVDTPKYSPIRSTSFPR